MRDLLGSVISPGSLLWWLPKGIPIHVARIEEPPKLLTLDRNTPPARAKLVLEIVIPIDLLTEGAETQLGDFLCIVDPQAEAAIEKMLEGKRKQ